MHSSAKISAWSLQTPLRVAIWFVKLEETPVENIAIIVERYRSQDTWKGDTIFEESSFDLLQNILEEAGELPARVPYADLVTTEFAEKAAGN